MGNMMTGLKFEEIAGCDYARTVSDGREYLVPRAELWAHAERVVDLDDFSHGMSEEDKAAAYLLIVRDFIGTLIPLH